MRVGELVQVRSREEILATLDEHGRLDGLPFMPQMLDYCGRVLRVEKSAHKTCDTVSGRYVGRRMVRAVHLEGIRCDGVAYGDCGAACTVFWKEAWLRHAGTAPTPRAATGAKIQAILDGTRAPAMDGSAVSTYVCQATELLRASHPLPWWNVLQYWEDLRSGNAGLGDLASAFAFGSFWMLLTVVRRIRFGAGRILVWLYDRFQELRGGVPFPRRNGKIPDGSRTPNSVLDLQAGELVRVKSYEEILNTLGNDNKNRGLYFDAEMVPFCGKVFRVRSRVKRIVDEKTGKLLEFGTAAVILEGAACQARYSNHRMMCPRAIYAYWREIWLERVPSGGHQAAPQSGPPSAGR